MLGAGEPFERVRGFCEIPAGAEHAGRAFAGWSALPETRTFAVTERSVGHWMSSPLRSPLSPAATPVEGCARQARGVLEPALATQGEALESIIFQCCSLLLKLAGGEDMLACAGPRETPPNRATLHSGGCFSVWEERSDFQSLDQKPCFQPVYPSSRPQLRSREAV